MDMFSQYLNAEFFEFFALPPKKFVVTASYITHPTAPSIVVQFAYSSQLALKSCPLTLVHPILKYTC